MKVAYLFSRYPVPSQTFCDTEMRALEAAGAQVEIFSCSPPTASFRHGPESRPKAQIFYAPPGPALAAWETAARRRGEWPADLIAEHETRFGAEREPARRALHALYFADLAKRRGIDWVHVHFANRATHAALFLRALGGPPFSFTAHAQDFMVDLGNDALLGEMCRQARFVVAVSDFSRALLAEKFPDCAARIHRIYNGLELEAWPKREANTRAWDDRLRIFSVGRLIDFKGFADLIAACAELKAQEIAVDCRIAGEGPLRGALEAQIRESGLTDSVRLVGLIPQTEVQDQMRDCDVFTLACRVDERGACDVLPTVILEAMAAGRPVVSTTVAGVPEMVIDGQTGLLSAPGDAPALADALAVLGDAAVRERMGRAGRQRFEKMFAAQKSCQELLRELGWTQSGDAAEATGGILVVTPQWPTADGVAQELKAHLPELRLMALGCLPRPALAAAERVRDFEFLPDAMVMESIWRDDCQLAHRMESWRAELGSSVDTEEFLRDSRRALCLHHRESGSVRHLHAVGAGSLLVCWLAARLGHFTASYGVERAPALLKKLESGFVGGSTDVAEAGGETHAAQLRKWAGSERITE